MDDAFVKQWLSDLRALLFDADDPLDLHNTLFLRPDPNPNPNRKRSWLALDRPLCHHRIGAQIAEIHKRLAEIAEGRKNFHLRPGDGRRRAPVGGRRHCYQSPSSSSWCDIRRAMKETVEAITRSKYSLLSLHILQHRLGELLRMNRFLLVLDNLWAEDRRFWEIFWVPLLAGESESKLCREIRVPLKQVPKELFLKLSRLRVLDLSNSEVKELPDFVGDLIHLSLRLASVLSYHHPRMCEFPVIKSEGLHDTRLNIQRLKLKFLDRHTEFHLYGCSRSYGHLYLQMADIR
ncbi:hypothetical protein ACMD2_24532 [Ananas comosus]|uniref:Rx N-terminal domain-containing protein n=1 Tax=Ananas comosus TaxID=4615 RepID=A0A199VH13_ANACO|nr:hypothetical protein ACMD2_24532 [Ananas comosus]